MLANKFLNWFQFPSLESFSSMWIIILKLTRQTAWIKVSFSGSLNLGHVITAHLSELKDNFFFVSSFNQQLIWVSNCFLITAEYFCAACCVKETHPSIFLYLFRNSSGFSVHGKSNFQQVSPKIWSISSHLCTCISTRNAAIFWHTHRRMAPCQWKTDDFFPPPAPSDVWKCSVLVIILLLEKFAMVILWKEVTKAIPVINHKLHTVTVDIS